MLDGLVPDLAPRLMIAIGGVAIAFLVFIAVLIFLRRRNSPLFIKGGRVREHRLLVMDAAAVDAKRRLVLVRRDDVEHLIMIGGPSDIVIETGIAGNSRLKAAAPASAAERPGVGQWPVATQKPATAPVPTPSAKPVAASPAAANPAVVTAIRSAPDQAEAMRRRQAQNGDAAQNARRQERQAARAAEAAKANAAKATAVSAMGPLLYSDDRAQTADAKTEAQAGETAQPTARAAEQQPRPTTVQAENILDVARGRVLPQGGQEKPAGNDEAIRQLEAQLEASKAATAEAARIEAAKAEAAKAEEARAQAARLEAERVAAVRADAERAEAVRAEAARLEVIRIEAQKAETARLEAERAEKARLEAERAEAESAEAERIEAEKAEAARTEAARIESERVAAARAEAMARFEAARRAQAEQRQQAQHPQQPVAEQTALEQPVVQHATATQQPVMRQAVTQLAQWPVAEPERAEPAISERTAETASLEDESANSQERLASDFEKLLEAELEADGVLDHYPAPAVAGERREQGVGTPAVNPVKRDTQPITGAVPGVSIEHDMARRLGEISLNKKNDAL